MLKGWVISASLVTTGGVLQTLSRNYGAWYAVFPIITLIGGIFLIRSDFKALKVLAVGVFSLLVWPMAVTGSVLFLVLYLVAAAVLTVIYLYKKQWEVRIGELALRRQSMESEKKVLEERFEVRMESLNHLERQVSGLVKLFEMARDLNECLSFSSLVSAIQQKIINELGFLRGCLILADPIDQTRNKVGQVLNFALPGADAEEIDQEKTQACFDLVSARKQVVKIESLDTPEGKLFARSNLNLPLWLFPLQVEHRLVALFATEGAIVGDFPKYEIFASQLALTVKKIRLYETVKEISIMDSLTGVFVRRHFLERFQEELRRAFRYEFPLSVLMVDVDHFKSYNDKYGHLVGDKALREVAHLIRDNIRRVDVLGRYGGEEFIVVAPEINKSKAVELAERIRSAIARKRFRLYDEETQVTVSIGVSSFPEDLAGAQVKEKLETEISALIEKADQALYRAKEEGRNRVVFYQSS